MSFLQICSKFRLVYNRAIECNSSSSATNATSWTSCSCKVQITNEIKVCKQHSLQPLAYQRCNLPQFLINESTLTIPSQWNDQQIWNVVCCCFFVQCISATHFIQILQRINFSSLENKIARLWMCASFGWNFPSLHHTKNYWEEKLI